MELLDMVFKRLVREEMPPLAALIHNVHLAVAVLITSSMPTQTAVIKVRIILESLQHSVYDKTITFMIKIAFQFPQSTGFRYVADFVADEGVCCDELVCVPFSPVIIIHNRHVPVINCEECL